ncbi:MAG: hypothetical protein QXV01_06105 [Candidatus Bathyarchaeia archaeon]
MIEKNPGHVRSPLGEPLYIWWIGRVLSERKPVWTVAKGPLKVDDVEVDAISILSSSKEFSVAEIKVSKLCDKLVDACDQAATRTKIFMNLDKLRRIFNWIEEPCKPLEVAVVTLYNLGSYKTELKSELAKSLEREGLKRKICISL